METSEATQNADILKLKEDVKNAGKVDDVTVGGVSVVENKVAKIPAIPSANELVPYEGATKDVNLGQHNIIIGTPIANNQAATKKYVDDKVGNSGGKIFQMPITFYFPEIPAGGSTVLYQDTSPLFAFEDREVLGMVPYSGSEYAIVEPTFWSTTHGFDRLTVRVTNIGNEPFMEGDGCVVNVTIRNLKK